MLIVFTHYRNPLISRKDWKILENGPEHKLQSAMIQTIKFLR